MKQRFPQIQHLDVPKLVLKWKHLKAVNVKELRSQHDPQYKQSETDRKKEQM